MTAERRCRHSISSAELPPEAGGWTCWRPVVPGGDRCVWHATDPEKSANALPDEREAWVRRFPADAWAERLDDADLRNVDLEGVGLRETTLYRARLDGAGYESERSGADARDDLEGARLRGASLRETSLRHASLRDADLREADLRGADLLNADLSGVQARHADLTDANLRFADLSEATLVRGELRNASLAGAHLPNATLISARLQGATLRGATVTDVDLQRARLVDARMRDVDADGVDLYKAAARDVDLRDADLSGARLLRAALDGADLRDADATDASLYGASLTGTDLRRAVLTRANLFDATLTDARLYGAVLADAKINDSTDFGVRGPEVGSDASSIRERVWTNRTIERLSGENGLTEQARGAYLRRKDAERRLHRERGRRIDWLWATLSGSIMRYGESPVRVGVVSLVVILAGSLVFPGTGVYASIVSFLDPVAGATAYDGLPRLFAAVQALVGAVLLATLVFVFGRRSTW